MTRWRLEGAGIAGVGAGRDLAEASRQDLDVAGMKSASSRRDGMPEFAATEGSAGTHVLDFRAGNTEWIARAVSDLRRAGAAVSCPSTGVRSQAIAQRALPRIRARRHRCRRRCRPGIPPTWRMASNGAARVVLYDTGNFIDDYWKIRSAARRRASSGSSRSGPMRIWPSSSCGPHQAAAAASGAWRALSRHDRSHAHAVRASGNIDPGERRRPDRPVSASLAAAPPHISRSGQPVVRMAAQTVVAVTANDASALIIATISSAPSSSRWAMASSMMAITGGTWLKERARPSSRRAAGW